MNTIHSSAVQKYEILKLNPQIKKKRHNYKKFNKNQLEILNKEFLKVKKYIFYKFII